jgi:hypothetical protein
VRGTFEMQLGPLQGRRGGYLWKQSPVGPRWGLAGSETDAQVRAHIDRALTSTGHSEWLGSLGWLRDLRPGPRDGDLLIGAALTSQSALVVTRPRSDLLVFRMSTTRLDLLQGNFQRLLMKLASSPAALGAESTLPALSRGRAATLPAALGWTWTVPLSFASTTVELWPRLSAEERGDLRERYERVTVELAAVAASVATRRPAAEVAVATGAALVELRALYARVRLLLSRSRSPSGSGLH